MRCHKLTSDPLLLSESMRPPYDDIGGLMLYPRPSERSELPYFSWDQRISSSLGASMMLRQPPSSMIRISSMRTPNLPGR